MKHVLVTGGTKGIGRACVYAFGAGGWSVTTLARSPDDLRVLARHWKKEGWPGELRTLAVDLSRPEQLERVPAIRYDCVVLNAGSYRPGPLISDHQDPFSDLFGVNVLANHRLARRLVPAMVSGRRGHLIAIGSTGTDDWPPHMTAYVATKYALRGLFRGWQRELAGTGVLVSLLAPGATLTDSWAGEAPPPEILAPERVAAALMEILAAGSEGRITIGPGE